MDRRFSKTLPRLELDPALTDRVISLFLESESGEGTSSNSFVFAVIHSFSSQETAGRV